ncbi:MAG TPA: hypothetical protein PK358_10940 [Spirochaetota bacterium]|nr:hypothetical protein [Spirochaetota bacterium]HPJ35343.1 hypothetical protein [Spirochaetota bacterium]
MKLFYAGVFFAVIILLSGCSSIKLKEPYASDFTTSGPLGEDCFQVVVKAVPDREAITMHERRESAFIKARENIYAEAEKQIAAYITSVREKQGTAVKDDADDIKKTARGYAESGKVEQEFYLIDNTAVLIYRIHNKGIKKKFSEN